MLSVLMVGFPKFMLSQLSSFQLLIAGGLLLGVAAFIGSPPTRTAGLRWRIVFSRIQPHQRTLSNLTAFHTRCSGAKERCGPPDGASLAAS